jgi:hypothetical protein
VDRAPDRRACTRRATPPSRTGGRGGYFTEGLAGPEDTRPRIDAVFVTDQAAVPGRPTVTLDYPLRTDAVTVDTVARLKEGVERFQIDAAAQDLTLDSSVGAVLDDIDAEAAALGRTVPLVAVPLVLVAWFVVFLVVAGVAEERAPEVGPGQAARVLAAPGERLRTGRVDRARGWRPCRWASSVAWPPPSPAVRPPSRIGGPCWSPRSPDWSWPC